MTPFRATLITFSLLTTVLPRAAAAIEWGCLFTRVMRIATGEPAPRARLTPEVVYPYYRVDRMGEPLRGGFHDVYLTTLYGKKVAVVAPGVDVPDRPVSKSKVYRLDRHFDELKKLEAFGGPKVLGWVELDYGDRSFGRRPGIALEFLEGTLLAAWENASKTPPPEQKPPHELTAEHFASFEKILKKMWDQKVLCNDFTMGNIMIGADGTVRPFDNWPVPVNEYPARGDPGFDRAILDRDKAVGNIVRTINLFASHGWTGAEAWAEKFRSLYSFRKQ